MSTFGRFLVALNLLLLLAQQSAAALAQSPIDPTTVSVAYRIPGMERTTVRAGVVFDKSMPTPLAFDAYIPRGLRATERRPAIIFVSGAENVRRWRWFISWGQIAAARGFVGIVPDKRYPRGPVGTRAGCEDTEKLLAHLRTNSAGLPIDPRRICVWTFSGGGRLTSVGLQPEADGVRCLVSFYGLLDSSADVAGSGSQTERESFLRRFSPVQALEALIAGGRKSPPVFIARAGQDSAVINNSIDQFTATALRLNAPVTVINYPEGVHGFDGLNDTQESRTIIEAALNFVRKHTIAS